MSNRPIIYIIGRNRLYPGIHREGWMNCRMASQVTVEESADAYIVTSSTHGIQPEKLQIWYQNEHLFMEGPITSTQKDQKQIGRYVRALPCDEPVDGHSLIILSIGDATIRIQLRKSKAVPPTSPEEIQL